MGQSCTLPSVAPDASFRKSNCLSHDTSNNDAKWKDSNRRQAYGNNDDPDAVLPLAAGPDFDVAEVKACSGQGKGCWKAGSSYAVLSRKCTLREAPSAHSRPIGDLFPCKVTVLLKVHEAEDGTFWGLLDPPPAATKLVPGWIVLEGEDCTTPPLELKRDLGWEVGRTYRTRAGTKVRKEADRSSAEVCILSEGDTVEVLGFAVIGDGEGKRPRLRARIMTRMGARVGWVSPLSEDGVALLKPVRVVRGGA